MLVRLSALGTGRLYPSRKYSWYSFLLEAESTPGPQCDRKDFMSMKIPMTPAGIDSATFPSVAQHLNYCATAVANVRVFQLVYMHLAYRWDVGMWTGLGWPRIETGGGRL